MIGESDIKCSLKTERNVPGHECFQVLDGQQRLITTRLWLLALLDEYKRVVGKYPAGYEDRSQLTEIEVHALDQEEWDRIKTQDVLNAKEMPFAEEKERITLTYLYFRYLILQGSLVDEEVIVDDIPPEKDGETLLETWTKESEADHESSALTPENLVDLIQATINKLELTVLEWDKENDEDVEVIFETINATRTELGQYDLFRNYVLIQSQTTGQEQRSLYDRTLQEAELKIKNMERGFNSNLDQYLYDFLIAESRDSNSDFNMNKTSKLFRSKWLEVKKTGVPLDSYLDSVITPTMWAWYAAASGAEMVEFGSTGNDPIALGEEVQRKIWRLESFSRGPFIPLVLQVLRYWITKGEGREEEELISSLHLIETYAARQLLAGRTFSPLRSEMMRACAAIDFSDPENHDKHDLKSWVRENTPTDQRIFSVATQTCTTDDGKEPNPETDWLARKEVAKRLTPAQLRALFDALHRKFEGPLSARLLVEPGRVIQNRSSITIEHFYPQKDGRWLADLQGWKIAPELMENRLHSLGNISVLPSNVNITLSNKKLSDKQKDLDKNGVPNFTLNRDFFNAEKWTPEEIDKRTKELTEKCLEIWPLPE